MNYEQKQMFRFLFGLSVNLQGLNKSHNLNFDKFFDFIRFESKHISNGFPGLSKVCSRLNRDGV